MKFILGFLFHVPNNNTNIIWKLLLIIFIIRSVPGIGRRTVEQLTAVHLDTLGQLRQASIENIVEAGILRYVFLDDLLQGLGYWSIDPVGLGTFPAGVRHKENDVKFILWVAGT